MTRAQVISLFPKGVDVGVGITDPRRPEGVLYPSEELAISRAVPKRRDEFRAGRSAARQAMRAVGAAPSALPARKDRLPDWPEGIAGSITHCRDLCVACASTGARAIGLDVETATELPADLWETILLPDEHEAVRSSAHPGALATLIFSSKEAAYKAQYPLSETLFGFHDLGVSITGSGHFQACFRTTAGPFQPGDTMRGRYLKTQDHILTAVVLT
ncbi:4'-phosphopantetheinyl transferase family protein [Thalassovita sp.]|uniref:4'-phosphopantetheinyl transferase family protein n=1 Tax=Thalassovita sp. TaxID=1979401 RepID=UPI003B58E987